MREDFIAYYRPLITSEMAEYILKLRETHTWRAVCRDTAKKFNIEVEKWTVDGTTYHSQTCGIALCQVACEKLGKKFDYYD